MASEQCATIPTLTRTDERTIGTTTIETEVLTTTTAPPTFTTHTISTDVCTTNTTSPTSTRCTPTFTTSIETIEGATTVLTSTTTTESPLLTSITTTLFTTTCSTPNGDNNNNNDPPTTTTPTTTPTPSLTTSLSSFTTDGVVSVSTYTLTAAPSPTTQTDSNSSSDGPNVGAIAGGVVGGVVGLVALAMISWYFYKKSTSGFDRVFNNPDDLEPSHNHQDKPGPLDDEVQGKGYQYGLMGNEMGNGAGGNGVNATGPSPNGNGMGPFNGGQEMGNFQGPHGVNEMGYQPGGNETGYQPDLGHARNHSLAPLLGAVGGAAAGAAVYAAATTANNNSHSRPSTGGSGQPLISPGPSPQAYGPQTYPPQSQGYSRTSYYGSSDHNHTGYNPSLNTNPSVGSSSWAAASSSAYSAPQPHSGMMAPLVASAVPPSMHRPQQSLDGRSGSPVSIQEQRVLQVINPDTGLPTSPQGSSALVDLSSPTTGSSSLHHSTSVDGKGRPIDTRGQFVPLVHLDGGAYEEPTGNAVAGGSNTPLPPAYTS